jgi:hypothetical protein
LKLQFPTVSNKLFRAFAPSHRESKRSPSPGAQVLVVIISPALYLSKPALEEIYNALESASRGCAAPRSP